ncbi:MAG: MarP family serine protease [Microbacterium sp.]
MVLVDVLVVILLVLALAAGLRAGFFSVLGAFCGLVAGGVAALWVLPLVSGLVSDPAWHGLAVVVSAIGLLAVGTTVGTVVGGLLRRGADKLRLRLVERLLGGGLAVVAAALALSLTGAGIVSAGIPGLSSLASSSTVLRAIDRFTPTPLTDAVARWHAAVLGDTVLPALDGLLEQSGLASTPDLDAIDTDDPKLLAAGASVARVSGVAYGCGTTSTGSGFVVASNRVVTNAHVVAGVDTPVVELPNEPARDGRVVYFDPVDDIAVIAVDVDAAPLELAKTLDAGSPAVVQGYPYGGSFRTVAAGVTWTGRSVVDDIYGERGEQRAVYALDAEVNPGNSGGPVLTTDGDVAGVVFAKDSVRAHVGYAMTTAELRPVVAALDDATQRVSTGACLS